MYPYLVDTSLVIFTLHATYYRYCGFVEVLNSLAILGSIVEDFDYTYSMESLL